MTVYLDRAENEIQRLFDDNNKLRTENERLRAEKIELLKEREVLRDLIAILHQRVADKEKLRAVLRSIAMADKTATVGDLRDMALKGFLEGNP